MNDNFYLEDLILSLEKETTLDRYQPLFSLREELLCFAKEQGLLFRDDVDGEMLSRFAARFGQDTAALFKRFLHLYDFGKAKLKELGPYQGTAEYAALADLLRLPGVRLLRAELYLRSGVTLETLTAHTTAEIQAMVRAYVEREHRPETVPFPKEINCHRAVARMILHLKENE